MWICTFLCSVLAFGQNLDHPNSPENFLYDKSQIFDNRAEIRHRIQERLSSLSSQRRFSIYLVALSGEQTQDLHTLGTDLSEAWLSPQQNNGLIILCHQDLGRIEVVQSELPASSQLFPDSFIGQAVTEALSSSATESDQALFLDQFTTSLVGTIEAELTKAKAGASLSAIVTLALALLTLLVAFGYFFRKRQSTSSTPEETAHRKTYVFPVVKSDALLGANQGGLSVTVHDFSQNLHKDRPSP